MDDKRFRGYLKRWRSTSRTASGEKDKFNGQMTLRVILICIDGWAYIMIDALSFNDVALLCSH